MNLRIIKERSIWWIGMPWDMILQIILLESLIRHEGDLKAAQKDLQLSDHFFHERVNRLILSGIKLPKLSQPRTIKKVIESPVLKEPTGWTCKKHLYVLPIGKPCPLCAKARRGAT